MWSIFKSKKETEQERSLAEQKVISLKAELKTINEKVSTLASEKWNDGREEEKRRNSICPKCGSIHVNDRIKRQQGEISGEFGGGGWSALTFGSSSSYGSISGKMDTNEVNKCNDCQHEWKKYTSPSTWGGDILRDEVRNVSYLLEAYYNAGNCKFDSLDVEEKYNSLAEKKSALLEEANHSWRLDKAKTFWRGVSLDAFNALAKKQLSEWRLEDFGKYYDEEKLLSLGFKK